VDPEETADDVDAGVEVREEVDESLFVDVREISEEELVVWPELLYGFVSLSGCKL
jgi:hypothetical protein